MKTLLYFLAMALIANEAFGRSFRRRRQSDNSGEDNLEDRYNIPGRQRQPPRGRKQWQNNQFPNSQRFPSIGQMGQFPGQGINFPGQDDLFPGQNGQFPGQNGLFPGQQGQFPGQNGQFPSQQGQFPGQQGQFPGQNGQFPGQQGQFPGQQGQFPGQNGQFPGQQGQFPGGQFIPGQGQGQFPRDDTTTQAPTGSTTQSAAVAQCIRDCPVTSEYNPMCGTDGVTYNNPGRLTCAQGCGVNVSLLRASTCPPATTPAPAAPAVA